MTAVENREALVVGANSAIARALITRLIEQGYFVVAASRGCNAAVISEACDLLEWQVCDYSETSIKNLCSNFKDSGRRFTRVFICNGALHGNDVMPEKSLQQINLDNLHRIMEINAFIPLLWLKHLKSVLRGKQDCVVTTFSARVGSITDNRKGGWYAYRASKAALNMLMKTAAIEFQRDAGNVRFLLFHPGTADTPLSKPFQSSVPEGKLFSPEFVADCLLTITGQLTPESPIQYLDWQDKEVAW